MHVKVDDERCQGHGLCRISAPDLFFAREEDGNAYVQERDRSRRAARTRRSSPPTAAPSSPSRSSERMPRRARWHPQPRRRARRTPNDRLEPAAAMADSGRVAYIGFDCLAERTMALAQVRRRPNPAAGQDERIGALRAAAARLPRRRAASVVGNFGAANPDAAARRLRRGRCRRSASPACGSGSSAATTCSTWSRALDAELPELGTTVGALGDRVVSANAYIGAEPIVDCLREDAQIVLGGRLADPSLFVGPICHELGWALDDWEPARPRDAGRPPARVRRALARAATSRTRRTAWSPTRTTSASRSAERRGRRGDVTKLARHRWRGRRR